jgi:hypothetical protein
MEDKNTVKQSESNLIIYPILAVALTILGITLNLLSIL